MQVYKVFFKVAKAKLPSMLIYFVVFLVLAGFMSNVASSDSESVFQAASVNICVIDQDKSTASQALYDYLDSIHKITKLRAYDEQSLQDNLYYHEISYILTIPEGFEKDFLDGKTDGLLENSKRKDTASGYFLDQQIENYLANLSLAMAGGLSLDEAAKTVSRTLEELPEVESVSFGKKTNSQNQAIFYFFQYLPYVLIMMLIEGLAPILITFHNADISARINCSSFAQSKKNTQLGLGCLSFSLICWIAFVVLCLIMYGAKALFTQNGYLCLLNSFVFVLIATSITLLVGNFKLNGNVLNMVANMIGLSMSFLCGVFVPQWLLGDAVLSFARFLPMYWYIKNNDMISGFSGETMSMSAYWTGIGIQVLFLTAIFAVYLATNRQRKRESLA